MGIALHDKFCRREDTDTLEHHLTLLPSSIGDGGEEENRRRPPALDRIGGQVEFELCEQRAISRRLFRKNILPGFRVAVVPHIAHIRIEMILPRRRGRAVLVGAAPGENRRHALAFGGGDPPDWIDPALQSGKGPVVTQGQLEEVCMSVHDRRQRFTSVD